MDNIKEGKYIDSDGQILNILISHLMKKYYNSNWQLHRLDGPAVEWKDGSYDHLQNGRWHRIGGPSYFDHSEDYYQWCVNGQIVEVYYICG